MLTDLSPENYKDYHWFTGYSAQDAIDNTPYRGGWNSILSFAQDWACYHDINNPVLINDEDIVAKWLRDTGTDLYICPRDLPITPDNLTRL